MLDVSTEGEKIRAKIQKLEQEERPSNFFKKREKSRAIKSVIGPLNVNGSLIVESEDVIKCCKDYYQSLYSREQVDAAMIDYFVADIPHLTSNQAACCNGPITYDECWKAIKEMKPNRSPGSDGLPKEFYELYFPLFGNDYINVINNAFSDGIFWQNLND